MKQLITTMTTTERFTILKNGVDERLKIIRDNETEFYNITKTAKMIAKTIGIGGKFRK